jgi:hypothetical protein
MLLPFIHVQASPAKYDGERLFLPAFPFVAITSAVAVTTLARTIKQPWAARALLPIVCAALVIYLADQNRRYYPYPDSYFSESIGGVAGAERLGFDVQYWCNSAKGVLGWMSHHQNARFWAYPCDRILGEYWGFGAVSWRPQFTRFREQADFAVFFNRTAEIGEEYSRQLKGAAPEESVDLHGVRLAGIYTQDQLPPGGPTRRR